MNKLYFAALLMVSLIAPQSFAYHFPWDQGHDTTLPEDSSNKPGTGDHEGDGCDAKQGSPVYLKTGYFIWPETDVMLTGGKPLTLKRVYNSNDPKDGPFGKGWTFNCEVSLIKMTDTEETSSGVKHTSKYVYRLGNGRRLTFTQDSTGIYQAPDRIRANILDGEKPALVFDDGGKLVFNRQGMILQKFDRNNNKINYQYDGLRRITGMSNDFGQSITISYNASGRVELILDHSGRQWNYQYSSLGELIAVTNPLGHIRNYTYQSYKPKADRYVYSQLTQIKDEANRIVTDVTYNGVRVASYTEGENKYSYNYSADWVTKTDKVKSSWRFKLNDEGQIIEQVDSLNDKNISQRDEKGNLIGYTDPLGNSITMTRDEKGRLVNVDNGLITTKYHYNNRSNRPSSVYHGDRKYTFSYDKKGNMTATKDPIGNKTYINYNSQGKTTQYTDAEGKSVKISYTSQGWANTITDALNQRTLLGYNVLGHLTSMTDPAGKIYRFHYDELGRKIRETDAGGLVTHYAYDAASNLQSVTAPNGAVETYQYDQYGRLKILTRYDGSKERYTYRADNLVASSQDPSGVTTYYSYDANKRLIKMVVGSETVNYSYNKRGQITSISNRNDTITRIYDDWARLRKEITQGRSHSYTYTPYDEVASWNYNGQTINYEYDARSLLQKLSAPNGEFKFTWDKLGNLTRQTSPDGLILTNQYDEINRLLQRQYSGTVDKQWQYGYDGSNQITQLNEDGKQQTYNYDASERLTSAKTLIGDHRYQYDKMGNRLDFGGKYNKGGQLLEDDSYIYSYDKRGNRTSKSAKDGSTKETYSYNDLARLVSYQRERNGELEVVASYKYGPLGRRLSKTVNGAKVAFHWQGTRLISEGDERSYIYGPDEFSPLSVVDSNTSYNVLSDHLSAPVALSNGNDLSWEVTRTPYGISNQTGSSTLNISFPGQYIDLESGLHYNFFRNYDPVLAQYIERDPIGIVGGLNVFSYASSSPLNYIDPYGLSKKKKIIEIIVCLVVNCSDGDFDKIDSTRGRTDQGQKTEQVREKDKRKTKPNNNSFIPLDIFDMTCATAAEACRNHDLSACHIYVDMCGGDDPMCV
ncbi:RHS repeat-associated core domain-containing protein [Photobacterium sanguinicancri]|uniref:RHS repeat-associated core domain-containing protein n=1 Tax=Photobacterium sanguinicancri TaxID=875932 RepID=UPI002480B57E|nr:RHS repeat-associated core domain-containing protein [Photobacterium sanguinicancri]